MSEKPLDPETLNPAKEEPLPDTHKIGNIEVNNISEKGKKSIRSRVLVAIILIAIAVPCLIYGSWAWFGLVALASAFAGYEIVRAPQKPARWYIYLIVYIFLFITLFWTFIKGYADSILDQLEQTGCIYDFSFSLERTFENGGHGSNAFSLSVSPIALGLMLLVFFWLSIAQETFSFTDICYYFTMVLMVGLGLQAALYLRYVPFVSNEALVSYSLDSSAFRFGQSSELIVMALLGALLNDTFAYFGGMLFGRHHMNPRVSPKKTWEGFFVGWIATSLVLIAYCLILSFCHLDVLPGVFDLEHWYTVVIVSLLIPGLGDLGDLSFSLIKRHFVFKDYSHLLGPHGGMLDRIDSCLFSVLGVSVVVMVCLYWSYSAPSSASSVAGMVALL